MKELMYELFAVPAYDLRHVSIEENHHKWLLHWYRIGYGGDFCFTFESPRGRRYLFRAARGENGGRVTDAEITRANDVAIASYWERYGDSPAKMDAVIRLTPKHILRRLSTLLDAIG